MERIFIRDVAGFVAGEIRDLDWDSIARSMALNHGVTEPVDSYAIPVDEAARRYVATITPRETARSRRVAGT